MRQCRGSEAVVRHARVAPSRSRVDCVELRVLCRRHDARACSKHHASPEVSAKRWGRSRCRHGRAHRAHRAHARVGPRLAPRCSAARRSASDDHAGDTGASHHDDAGHCSDGSDAGHDGSPGCDSRSHSREHAGNDACHARGDSRGHAAWHPPGSARAHDARQPCSGRAGDGASDGASDILRGEPAWHARRCADPRCPGRPRCCRADGRWRGGCRQGRRRPARARLPRRDGILLRL